VDIEGFLSGRVEAGALEARRCAAVGRRWGRQAGGQGASNGGARGCELGGESLDALMRAWFAITLLARAGVVRARGRMPGLSLRDSLELLGQWLAVFEQVAGSVVGLGGEATRAKLCGPRSPTGSPVLNVTIGSCAPISSAQWVQRHCSPVGCPCMFRP
jgi:hypothetical protein